MNEMFNLPAGTKVLDPLTLNGIRFAGDHTVITPKMLDEMAACKQTSSASSTPTPIKEA